MAVWCGLGLGWTLDAFGVRSEVGREMEERWDRVRWVNAVVDMFYCCL